MLRHHPCPARRFALFATLVICWLGYGAARGGEVRDDGGFFGADAIRQVRDSVATIKQKYGADVVVESFAAIPTELRSGYTEANKEQFYDAWVERLGKETGAEIVILITRQPGRVQVGASQATRRSAFTAGDRDEVQQKVLAPAFRQRQFDDGIIKAMSFIEQRLAAHGASGSSGAAGGAAAGGPSAAGGAGAAGGSSPPAQTPAPSVACGRGSWAGLACLVIGGLILFMLVRRLFGSHQRNYGPPPVPGQGAGYGQPGYGQPGYGQGGGGGIGRGMLGGLFGGLLGGYAADRFLHRSGSGPTGAPFPGGGGPPASSDFPSPPPDTGPASTGFDFDAGPSTGSSGGDFGSSSADFGGSDSGGTDSGGSSGSDF